MPLGQVHAAYKAYVFVRPEKLKDGWNDVDGERVFFVRDPAMGLWKRR